MAVEIIVGHRRVEKEWIASEHRRMANFLPMWTVYENPLDFPGKWVARLFISLPESRSMNAVIIADGYAEMLAELPPGLHRLPRSANDEPHIKEVWL